MALSLLERLVKGLGPDQLFRGLTSAQRKRLQFIWPAVARPEQLAPAGDWVFWLILAGRGFGKTRAGAENCILKAKAMPGSRGFLAARTVGDVRDVMIEGESGILAKSSPDFMPDYEPSKRLVTWPNGSTAHTYSSDAPAAGRGPQHHWGWADEIAAWFGWELWDNLQMGLRLGELPQAWVTTTPRPQRIIRELIADPDCVVTRGSTYDNAANLPRKFFEKILRKYEGTRLGRQELLAELLDDVPGALWTRAQLDALHVKTFPEMERIVVAIDPATTSGEASDMTGIIVAGLGVDGLAYVLEDLTCQLSPAGWAMRAIDAFDRWSADLIVAETNQGGEMVESTLRAVKRTLPYKGVHARRGKRLRAEPVAALYEPSTAFPAARVRHVTLQMEKNAAGVWVPSTTERRPALADLDDQMVQFTPEGRALMVDPETGKQRDVSPDRVDAMVYALTELMLEHEEGWLVSSSG